MKSVLPDFKTERADVLPPLPAALKIIPVGFALSLIGLGAMAAYSFKGVKTLKDETAEMRAAQAVEQGRIKALQTQQDQLDLETKQAKEVQNWIAGNGEIYPMLMKIIRTVDKNTRISDLTIGRVEDNPSHIKMTIKLYATQGVQQADPIIQAIAEALPLRPYSPSANPVGKDENEVLLECNWAPSVALINEK